MRRLLGVLVGALGLLVVMASPALADGIAVSPQTSGGAFDYGTVEIGNRLVQTFHMTNLLSTKTRPLRVRLSGSSTFKKWGDTCSGERLAPGKSCLVRITYRPTTDGVTTTTSLTVNNKALTIEYGNLNLSGTGHGTANLVWTPSITYDFGSTGGSHGFTLTNVGTAPAQIIDVSDGFSPGPVISTDFGCYDYLNSNNPVPVGGSCTETVTFSPICGAAEVTWDLHVTYYTDSTDTTPAIAFAFASGESPPCT